MTEAQIRHMVDRFLGWRLPMATWGPDNGISYKRPNYHPDVDATPSGTNLFSADEATAMVRHMIEGMPDADASDGGIHFPRHEQRRVLDRRED